MSLKIVIVGGVAGGMSAATRARRMNESAQITVFEKGPYVSFANCGLPYYIAGKIITERKLLVTTPQQLKAQFEIDTRCNHEVTRIDRKRKLVSVINHSTGESFEQPYDKLILSPGASAIVPPIEHINAPNVFLMRTMQDMQRLHQWMKQHQPKNAVVVGAGFIGLEMVESLHHRGLAVTLIEKAPHAMPPLDADMAPWLTSELHRNDVRLITGHGLASLETDSPASDALVSAAITDDGTRISTDLLLLSIGVRPNTTLARDAEIALGPSGAIIVNESQQTSDPDIYAVGDAAVSTHTITAKPVHIPLAGPANRHGRAAGEHAATNSAPRASRVLGTAIVNIFNLAVAMTGLSETRAKQQGMDVDSAYIFRGDHAGFYPGASPIQLKLIYERKTGKILGAQALGYNGVDKRIDIIATAMHFGGTIDDLADLDLAYAPQFGAAKDPIHIAAFVAQNQRHNQSMAIAPHECLTPTPHGHLVPTAEFADDNTLWLDVREPAECNAGMLPGAVNIPLGQIRSRLDELPRNKQIITYCGVGQRAYVAQQILRHNGFDRVRNLKGGYTLATMIQPL